MSKNIEIAGIISFGGKLLNVYGDLDAPLFKAKDISHVIEYSSGNEWKMLEMCEDDEKLKLPMVVAGHFSAHFWVLGFDQSPLIFDQSEKIEEKWSKKSEFWSNFWPFARFLPTFKTPL